MVEEQVVAIPRFNTQAAILINSCYPAFKPGASLHEAPPLTKSEKIPVVFVIRRAQGGK